MSKPLRVILAILAFMMIAPIVGAAWLAMTGIKIVSTGIIIATGIIGVVLLISVIGGKK